ncbi:hypothetical protein [Streptomyces sp. NPDC057052]|uniref:hypothetical protein n=1 Tax=Streptomyces sp. NPDC057052 TaxID=3346010 RepID=UPI00362ECE22
MGMTSVSTRRWMAAADLGGGEELYTAVSEGRILDARPDVHDCTGCRRRSEGGS